MEKITLKYEEVIIRGLKKSQIPRAIEPFIEGGNDVGIGMEVDGTYVVSSRVFVGRKEEDHD